MGDDDLLAVRAVREPADLGPFGDDRLEAFLVAACDGFEVEHGAEGAIVAGYDGLDEHRLGA